MLGALTLSPISLNGMWLKKAQGQLYLYLIFNAASQLLFKDFPRDFLEKSI
jgi:hypothetical protein